MKSCTCSLMPQRVFVKTIESSKFNVCLVMTFLRQQTQIHRNKAGVLNLLPTNIFPTCTFYVRKTLHLKLHVLLVCDHFNHIKASTQACKNNYHILMSQFRLTNFVFAMRPNIINKESRHVWHN